jgi:hypothetical protein
MHHYNAKDLGEVTVVRGPSFLNYGYRDDGNNVKTYASIEDAVIAVGYHNIMALRDRPHLGGFRDSIFDVRGRYQRVPIYCEGGDGVHVYDELGCRVPAWKLQEVADNIPNDVWNYTYAHWRKAYREEDFRKAPVPGTRKFRGFHGCYRRPETKQEYTENNFLYFDEDAIDYGVKPRPGRATRGFDNLPSSWDDVSNGRRGNNWKHYRKHQWKE